MYVDELIIQIKYMDEMFHEIINRYKYNNDYGYRIKQDMEHEAAGICGLQNLHKEEERPNPEEDMCVLFFLLNEETRMIETVSKYQKDNNMILFRAYPGKDCDHDKNKILESVRDKIKMLYRKNPVRKQVQKAVGGYDMIVTKTSKIDKSLLDKLHYKFNQEYEAFQKNRERCQQAEIDYEPTIDFSQYEQLGFKAFMCRLKEEEGIREWKLQ